MPYSDRQVKLFQGIAHGSIKKPGLTRGKASKMLAEAGQSKQSGHKRRSSAASKLSHGGY